MIGTLSSEEIEMILHRNRSGRLRMDTPVRSVITPVSLDYDGRTLLCWYPAGPSTLVGDGLEASVQIVEERPGDLRHVVVMTGRIERLNPNHERMSSLVLPDWDAAHAWQNMTPFLVVPSAKTGRFVLGSEPADLW